jgi:hypothetical protein
MADLVALKPDALMRDTNLVVRTLGYHTPGDDGGQDFWIRQASAGTNFGAVLNSLKTGWQWHAVSWDGDVRKFGAISQSDDTYASHNVAAIRAAIDYAVSDGTQLHKLVRIPTGTFYVNDTIFTFASDATPGGSSYETGRLVIKGDNWQGSRLVSIAETNNVIFIGQGEVTIEHLAIESAGARTTSTAPDYKTGHGIYVTDQQDGAMARFRLIGVTVRGQPNEGLHFHGPVEMANVQDCIFDGNRGWGFMASKGSWGNGGFQNLFMNTRSIRNDKGGWAFTNSFNYTLLSCEAIDNEGQEQILIRDGQNFRLILCDVESQSNKTAPITALTSATFYSTNSNQFYDEANDFEALGLEAGMHIILSGGTTNNRPWYVTQVDGKRIYVDTTYGSVLNYSPGPSITVQFTRANWGLTIRAGGRHTVDGGYFGTLVGGARVHGAFLNEINRVHFINANLVGWTAPHTIYLSAASDHNRFTHMQDVGSYLSGYSSLVYDLSAATNNVFEVYNKRRIIELGEDGSTQPGMIIRGGASGQPMLKLDRSGSGAVGFIISSQSGRASLIASGYDGGQIFRAEDNELFPALYLGQDSNNSQTMTNALIAAGRRNTGGTDLAPTPITIAPGVGTGVNNDQGQVFIATPNQAGAATTKQTLVNRVVVGPLGMKIQPGGVTGNPASTLALEVTSNAQGFAPPRITTAERDAVTGWGNGTMIYNTTTGTFQGYAVGSWVDFH